MNIFKCVFKSVKRYYTAEPLFTMKLLEHDMFKLKQLKRCLGENTILATMLRR